MSVQRKIVVFLISFCIITIATTYGLANILLQNDFKKIETMLAHKETARLQTALNSQLQQLEIIASDYAGWDDTFSFVQDRNERYVQTNLVNETFQSAKIDYIFMFDLENQLVYGKGFDSDNKQDLSIPADLKEVVNLHTKIIQKQNTSEGIKGLARINERIVLLSAYPIVTSEKKGPIQGTLIAARLLDDIEMKKIADVAALEVSLKPLRGGQDISPGEIKTTEYGDSKNLNTLVLTDINNEPILRADVITNKEISVGLMHAVKYLISVILVISLGGMIIGYTYIRQIMLKPLNRIVSEIRKISSSKDFSSRIQTVGKDEITSLAEEVNTMLQSIDESGKQLTHVNDELKKQRDSIEKEIDNRTHLLKEEQARFVASIDSFPDAFILTDDTGRVILTNNKLNQIFLEDKKSWTMAELTKTFDSVFDLKRNVELSQKEKKSLLLSGVAFRKRFLKIYIAPIMLGEEEKAIGTVIIVGDITEAVLSERSKDEFLSIASHELRTPLTAIKGNSEMIQTFHEDKLKDADLKEMVDDIHQASISLIDIVNTFLTTSMLEQGRMAFKNDNFDMVALVSQTVNKYKKMAAAKNITLTLSNMADNTIPFEGDRQRLEEVVTNLLSNAIKYTENGSIKVIINRTESSVKVSVIDTGVGIPQKRQSLLFKKFQQASTDIYTRDVTHGTGLGLYISKQIVEAMGGEIYLEQSTPGKGSIFTFTIPFIS